MAIPKSISCVIVAMLLGGSSLPAQRIVGHVTDALTHLPIGNVHVGSQNGSRFTGSLTAFDGSYSLDNLAAGDAAVVVNLNGYRLVNAKLTLASGETLTRDFEIHPLGRIFGKLTDRDSGEPIEGHLIAARRKEHSPGFALFTGPAVTPRNGAYDLPNLEPGDYILELEADSEPSFEKDPQAGATRKYYGQRWYPDVPRRDMATLVHLAEGESRNIDLSLRSRETYTLSGTLEVPPGYEGRPVSVSIRASENPRPPSLEMVPPAGFRIRNLTAGIWRLAFTGGDFLKQFPGVRADEISGDYQIEITDHDVDHFKAALSPGAGVTGEVRMLEPDAPLPDQVSFALVPTSAWFAQLRNGGIAASGFVTFAPSPVRDGRFHREFIRPGQYWPGLLDLPAGYAIAQVLFAGSKTAYDAIGLYSDATPITFVLTAHPGSIAGMVRDKDQKPQPRAIVILLPDPVPDRLSPAAVPSAESAADGAYAFRDLAPGNYRPIVLTGPDIEREGDSAYLRERAAKADPVAVRAGQLTTRNLTP